MAHAAESHPMQTHAGARQPLWRALASLVAFDLRRFRVVVAVVVGLEVLRAAFVEWLLHPSSNASGVLLGGAVEWRTLDVVLRGAAALVTALLIQADHPADDRSFLRSRPVSPWQLAAAKLTLLAALFVGLPAVVNGVRLLAYGAPPASLIASAGQFAVISGGVVVPAWGLALATRTLPRFIGVAIGLTVAWVTAMALLASYPTAPPLPDWQRLEGRGWTFALLMAVGGAACVTGYYRTRRPGLPAAAALLLVALPGVIPEPAADPAPAGIASGPLSLEGPLRLPPLFSLSEPVSSADTVLGGPLRLPEHPANLTTQLLLNSVRVTAGTFAPPATGVEYCCVIHSPAAAFAAAWGAVPKDTTPVLDSGFGVYIAKANAARLRDRVVDVDASARLRFMRHDLAGELALRAGQSLRTAHYLVEIVDIDTRAHAALCRVARFPALTSPRPSLSFYVGSRTGPVVESALWRYVEQTRGERAAIGGASGRNWVDLLTLPLQQVPIEADTRIYVVESRPAGELPTRIVGRGVRVFQPATDAAVQAR